MKIRLFSILLLADILFTGCVAEELSLEGGIISAIMEEYQTRTSVTDEGGFTWAEGDKVWLHTTSGSVVGTLSSGAGTSRAKFSFDTYIGEMTGKAVYPYNSAHSLSGDFLNVDMPASYDLGTSLSNTNAAMYGVVNSKGILKFRHLAGVMRFKFKGVPAGVNKFTITLDKKINGTFKADLLSDYPVLETEATTTESEKTITLNFIELTKASDMCLYVPLPVGTYNSLELGLYDDEQSVWTYSSDVTNTISRKTLKLMPVVTVSGEVGGNVEGGNPDDDVETISSRLYAQTEKLNQTKTLMEDNGKVCWSEKDRIIAFMKTPVGLEYEVDSEYAGKTDGFFHLLSSSSSNDLDIGFEQPNKHNVAYYPYSSDVECESAGDDYSLKVYLPNYQSYEQNSFSDGDLPMVAVSEDNDFIFKNVCGGIRLQFNGSVKISSIRIEGNNSEKLSGNARVIAHSDNTPPTVKMADDALNSVTLYCYGTQLNKTVTTDFLISLPPVEFTDGFTITVTDKDDITYVIKRSENVKITRSEFLTIPEETIDVAAEILDENFNPDQYIIYEGYDDMVPSGDSYWLMNPFFKSRVSTISEIELLFQMSGGSGWLFSSERPCKNNGAYVNSKGIVLRWNNYGDRVIDNEFIIAWDEIGLLPTDKILLNISVSKKTITVNGREFIFPYLTSFTDIEYLFSSYFYENDDGYAKLYGAVNSGSRLFYAKISDANGNVLYHGYASVGEYRDGTRQCAWKSIYNGVENFEFTRTNFEEFWVGQYTYQWKHFNGGIDSTLPPVPSGSAQREPNGDYIDEYGINHGEGIKIGNTVWAPVNCGYHAASFKYGMLYQWGRKYGQGYDGYLWGANEDIIDMDCSDSSVPELVGNSVSLSVGQSLTNVDKFYYGRKDWCNSSDDKLWNSGTEENPVKTEYDPCPVGWRVPTYAELEELSENHSSLATLDGQNGYWFSGASEYTANAPQVFLPSAGYRNINGSAYTRGCDGMYWSSNPRPYALSFYIDDVGVYSRSRANGYSVRCVQE